MNNERKDTKKPRIILVNRVKKFPILLLLFILNRMPNTLTEGTSDIRKKKKKEINSENIMFPTRYMIKEIQNEYIEPRVNTLIHMDLLIPHPLTQYLI